jgi:hypothetical protein
MTGCVMTEQESRPAQRLAVLSNFPHSVYRQVLGHDFQLLASELQRFHSMQGRVELSGQFTVKGPHSTAGRVMSAMFALPKATAETPFKFELDAGSRQATWRRHFPGRLMVSKIRVGAGVLVERFGPINFHFRLQADQGQLNMLLQSVTVFGIRAPKFLMPTVMAQETGAHGKLHFCVSAHLPLVGLLAEYRGYLDIEREALPA